MKTKNTNVGRQNIISRQPSCHVMVILPPDIRIKIEELAKAEDRSLSFICRRFIEQGLAIHSTKSRKRH